MTDEEAGEIKSKIHSLQETRLEEISTSWQVLYTGLIGCGLIFLGIFFLTKKLSTVGYFFFCAGGFCFVFSFVYGYIKSRQVIRRYKKILTNVLPFQIQLTKIEFEKLYLSKEMDKP